MPLQPEIRGEYVLLGTKTIDGVEAAEFAINMMMRIVGDTSEDDDAGHLDMTMTASGTQYIGLESGFPMGVAEISMEMTMEMTMPARGKAREMKMRMKSTVACEALK